MNLVLKDESERDSLASSYLGLGAAQASYAGALVPTSPGIVGWRAPRRDLFAEWLEAMVSVTVRTAGL